jgi:hypothetical protein
MSFFVPEVNAPGLGDTPREGYKRVNQSMTVNDRQIERFQDYLKETLRNNPSAAIFDLSTISSQYPGVTQLEPGSKIWGKVMDAQNAPIDIRDANYLSMTTLGRSLTGEEKKYVRKEDPSSQQFAGFLAANPQATLADFPTEEENKISAYYGRMIPKKGGFTGERFSSIAPLEYTGGMG